MRWLLLALVCVLGCGDGGRELADLRSRVESLEKDNAATEKQVESLRAAIAKPVAMPDRDESVVRAKSFVLVRDDGTEAGHWSQTSGNAELSMADASGANLAKMIVSRESSKIVSVHEANHSYIMSHMSGATGHFSENRLGLCTATGLNEDGKSVVFLNDDETGVILPTAISHVLRRSPAPSPQ